MKKIACLAAAALLAAACASSPTADRSPARPRLVVLLVVDGLPQRQLVDYRDQLAPDGLARFLDRGAWFADAHYGHAFTVTAAGHAVMLTGAYPHRTGIIGNEWRNAAGEIEYCTGDAAHRYIGHQTKRLDGTSPRNLRVETLGDVLRGADTGSKVIGISVKDRGAILPAGHKGTAYMYQAATGHFASSTYYMNEHPKWVADFNAANPAQRYFRAEWKPLLPEAAYARSLPDAQTWYSKGGALPKTIGEGDKPVPPFYAQLIASPFSDRLTLDFARAAIAGEGLGEDGVPDILSVSLSGHDYVNHAYGAESRISHDHVLQLDRALQDFWAHLDEKVGRANYVAVLTADHGFMPTPEHAMALGHKAGRQSGSQTLARLNKALASKHGQGQWVRFFSARAAVLDRATIAAANADAGKVAEDVRLLLLAEPGIAAAFTRAQLESGSAAGQPFFDQVRRTWHREISGDVEFVLRPYWMMTSSSSATTHGSPHPYDTHVPVAFYGPAWVKPGRRDERAEVVDIAPTLAAILGVPAPKASEGRALTLR
jgi:arylsulfatase A-like enzyme